MNKVLERAPYINMQGMQNAIDDLARTAPSGEKRQAGTVRRPAFSRPN